MLTFYHSPNSTSSATELLLAVLDIPHETKAVSLPAGDTRTPAYLSMSPTGRVPVIVDGDNDAAPIFESAAIAIYLGQTYGEAKGLYPAAADPLAGRCMSWIIWTNVSLAGAMSALLYNPAPSPDAQGEEAKVSPAREKALKEMQKWVQMVEDTLVNNAKDTAGQAYILNDKFTVADAHLYAFMSYSAMLWPDIKGYEAVGRWMKAIAQRPEVAKVQAQG